MVTLSRRWDEERKERERESAMGRAAPCSGWNLKYRASRTSTLAPETRETRRRDVEKPGNRTWTPRYKERALVSPLLKFPAGIGWSFQQVKKWKFRYTSILSISCLIVARKIREKQSIQRHRRSLYQFRVHRESTITMRQGRPHECPCWCEANEGCRIRGWQISVSTWSLRCLININISLI